MVDSYISSLELAYSLEDRYSFPFEDEYKALFDELNEVE